MAFLLFKARRMELNPAAKGIGDLKGAIADALTSSGFTDVVHTEFEVAGSRNAVRISVLYLFIGGRSFFEVVMAGGDASDVTQGNLNEVVNKIQNLQFL